MKSRQFCQQNVIPNCTQDSIQDKWQGLVFVWLNDALESISHIGHKAQKLFCDFFCVCCKGLYLFGGKITFSRRDLKWERLNIKG